MERTVHTFVRKRGIGPNAPVELYYSATGRALQLDLSALEGAGLPKPDLMRGRLVVASVEQALLAVALHLHGLYTRETEVDDSDFYVLYPQLLGPPKIQLRPVRGPKRTS